MHAVNAASGSGASGSMSSGTSGIRPRTWSRALQIGQAWICRAYRRLAILNIQALRGAGNLSAGLGGVGAEDLAVGERGD